MIEQIEYFTEIVKDHYTKSGFILNRQNINAIKNLVNNYPVYRLVALWERFLKKDWSYKSGVTGQRVTPQTDIMYFQFKIKKLDANEIPYDELSKADDNFISWRGKRTKQEVNAEKLKSLTGFIKEKLKRGAKK